MRRSPETQVPPSEWPQPEACSICGGVAHALDHVEPRFAGGPDLSTNLQWLCLRHDVEKRRVDIRRWHAEMTPEERQDYVGRLSRARLGKRHTAETKEKLRKTMTGRTHSEQTRRRIGEAASAY